MPRKLQRNALLGALLAAAVVAVPAALSARFEADDYIQLALIADRLPVELEQPRLDVYTFLDGDPENVHRLMDRGPVPWFAHPELEIRFWRPLTALLVALDWELFGTNPLGYHLHGLLWYLAAVVAVGLLLRELLPGRVFALAILLFAVASSHRQIVTWLASRYAGVSLTLGALALLLHVRRRREGSFGGWLSIVLWIAAMLAGESSLGWFAFLFAWEAVAAPGDRRQRVRALAVPTGVLIAWLVTYLALGYGTGGSGAYVNPLQEPLAFLALAPARLLALLACLVFGFQADVWLWQPQWRGAFVAGGALAIVIGAWLWRAARRWLEPEERGGLDALVIGAALALIPQTAGPLGPRSLAIASVGGAAFVAAVIVAGWQSWRRREPARRTAVGSKLMMAFAAVLFLSHAIVSPGLWFVWNAIYGPFVARSEQLMAEAELDDARIADQDVVVVRVSNVLVGLYTPARRGLLEQPTPRSWRILSMRPGPLRLRRAGERQLELEVLEALPATPFELILRSPDDPLQVGDQVELTGFEAEVLDVSADGPRLVRFTFDRPLDDPGYVWLDHELKALELPPIGDSLELRE